MELGSNVNVETKGNIITITIDQTKDLGPSSTKKTTMVATSSGYKPVGNIMLNLNAYKSKRAA